MDTAPLHINFEARTGDPFAHFLVICHQKECERVTGSLNIICDVIVSCKQPDLGPAVRKGQYRVSTRLGRRFDPHTFVGSKEFLPGRSRSTGSTSSTSSSSSSSSST